MKLKLIRETFTVNSTVGSLSINEAYECYTLEDHDRKLEDDGEKVYGETAIPRGVYDVVLDYSNRFKIITPRLVNVPGFTAIRIHSGNKHDDTEGCILVGKTRDVDWIGGSAIAFNALMQKLMDAEERNEPITIEVT